MRRAGLPNKRATQKMLQQHTEKTNSTWDNSSLSVAAVRRGASGAPVDRIRRLAGDLAAPALLHLFDLLGDPRGTATGDDDLFAVLRRAPIAPAGMPTLGRDAAAGAAATQHKGEEDGEGHDDEGDEKQAADRAATSWGQNKSANAQYSINEQCYGTNVTPSLPNPPAP